LSILLGYQARIGAWLLVPFLVPVTIQLHNFWAVADPTVAQMQHIIYIKNLSMLGGALLIGHVGAGLMSLDAWRQAFSGEIQATTCGGSRRITHRARVEEMMQI
jgi:uncharacterized membrane protein YphA (DoxX/SURF4 family)